MFSLAVYLVSVLYPTDYNLPGVFYPRLLFCSDAAHCRMARIVTTTIQCVRFNLYFCHCKTCPALFRSKINSLYLKRGCRCKGIGGGRAAFYFLRSSMPYPKSDLNKNGQPDETIPWPEYINECCCTTKNGNIG